MTTSPALLLWQQQHQAKLVAEGKACVSCGSTGRRGDIKNGQCWFCRRTGAPLPS